jgi:hypothetical protein
MSRPPVCLANVSTATVAADRDELVSRLLDLDTARLHRVSVVLLAGALRDALEVLDRDAERVR